MDVTEYPWIIGVLTGNNQALRSIWNCERFWGRNGAWR
jgi:hypothetical protein